MIPPLEIEDGCWYDCDTAQACALDETLLPMIVEVSGPHADCIRIQAAQDSYLELAAAETLARDILRRLGK